jgi:hypothetical protein
MLQSTLQDLQAQLKEAEEVTARERDRERERGGGGDELEVSEFI